MQNVLSEKQEETLTKDEGKNEKTQIIKKVVTKTNS